MPTPAPCGSWRSPLTTDVLVAESVRLSYPVVARDGTVYWLEGRPREMGRNALVTTGGDVLPAPWNARSRVYEYGGRSYALHEDARAVVFVDYASQELMIRDADGAVRPVGTPGGWRFVDLVVDGPRNRVLALGEHHTDGRHEPENAIVAIDLRSGRVDVLRSGHDFYATPRLSPDGRRLLYLAWDHPHMPWDAAALYVCELDDAGKPRTPEGAPLAGDASASVCAPDFLSDGSIVFAWEPEGFWNLHRFHDGQVRALHHEDAEFAQPLWQPGTTTWAEARVDGAPMLVCAWTRNGRWQVDLMRPDGTGRRELALPFTSIGQVAASGATAILLAGSVDVPMSVVTVDLARGTHRILRRSTELALDPLYLSRPEPVTFPTTDGDVAHGFYYPPTNPLFEPRPGERPPLLVTAHGGPTAATAVSLQPSFQYWTSRGFAVLDVNYRGSTGYGRVYRDRLRDRWGIYDVDDCIAGARHLATLGRVDPARLAIRGGSAGGYTVLAALTFRDAFAAGASHYGVGDLAALVRDTHKFEARYLDGLIGPWPAAQAVYEARSPLGHADKLRTPVIFFQGAEDKVVPPNQAETMVEALRRRGVPVAYLVFPGEQHGFRKAETIRRVHEAELDFYGRIFGFSPDPPSSEPLPIDNLPETSP